VAIWGTSADKNRAAERALTKHGGRVLVQACDVADEAAVDRAFAETVATLGRVDACFANAGVGGRSAGQGLRAFACVLEFLSGVRNYLPLNTGSRFSTNALAASGSLLWAAMPTA